jgi:transposase
MARPYSSDLRARVVEAVDEGATRYEAGDHFGISVASAVRWHQAWRSEGTIEAKPCGGSRSALESTPKKLSGLLRNNGTGHWILRASEQERADVARAPALDTRATAAQG